MVTKAKDLTAATITELTWIIATMVITIIMKDVQTRSKLFNFYLSLLNLNHFVLMLNNNYFGYSHRNSKGYS